jgi:hypothetical protein
MSRIFFLVAKVKPFKIEKEQYTCPVDIYSLIKDCKRIYDYNGKRCFLKIPSMSSIKMFYDETFPLLIDMKYI